MRCLTTHWCRSIGRSDTRRAHHTHRGRRARGSQCLTSPRSTRTGADGCPSGCCHPPHRPHRQTRRRAHRRWAHRARRPRRATERRAGVGGVGRTTKAVRAAGESGTRPDLRKVSRGIRGRWPCTRQANRCESACPGRRGCCNPRPRSRSRRCRGRPGRCRDESSRVSSLWSRMQARGMAPGRSKCRASTAHTTSAVLAARAVRAMGVKH